jgi:prepilin-type N-terminal cleavage/methylation domain-containing protein
MTIYRMPKKCALRSLPATVQVEGDATEAKLTDRIDGFSMIEMMIVVAIIGVIASIAVPGMSRWAENERLKSAGRSMAAAFSLAHGEAIRTGDRHIIFFQTDAQGDGLLDNDGIAVPILVINDGQPGSANQNCQIDAGEIIGVVEAERDVDWGVAIAPAKVPNDSGTGLIGSGSTFTDQGGLGATWAMFGPQGMPVSFTPACVIGGAGSGAGGVYLTNGKRDYAVVLTPLGGTRLHAWEATIGAWTI